MVRKYTVKHPVDLAIDAGNGTTCVASQRCQPFLFPSVVQQVEDVRLDGRGSQGFTIHVSPMRADNGATVRKSWAVGETANLLPGLKTRITTAQRIGSEYQLVLILAATVRALAEMEVSTADEITVGVIWLLNCPPVYYGMAGRLYDLAGRYVVEYDGKVYHLTATVQHVYPEGAGAAACYMLDSTGRFVNPQFASGRTGIVDAGYRTIDSAVFEGPVLLENTAQSLTNSITGVYHLAQRWALEEFGEDWTEQETETAIRRGYAVMRETKERVDLTGWIDDLGGRLADLVDADVFQKQWNGLGDVDRVILAGGVAYMIAPHLKERYPAVVQLRDDFPHTRPIGYELMNAVGHIRMLQAERLQSSKA